MTHSFTESIQIVRTAFESSAVLRSLGLSTSKMEILHRAGENDKEYRISFAPGPSRTLDIDYCYSPILDRNFFVTEIFNTAESDSFLLDRWMEVHPICRDHYPHTFAAFAGSFQERVDQFVSFLNRQLSDEDLLRVLRGLSWEHIYFEADECRP